MCRQWEAVAVNLQGGRGHNKHEMQVQERKQPMSGGVQQGQMPIRSLGWWFCDGVTTGPQLRDSHSIDPGSGVWFFKQSPHTSQGQIALRSYLCHRTLQDLVLLKMTGLGSLLRSPLFPVVPLGRGTTPSTGPESLSRGGLSSGLLHRSSVSPPLLLYPLSFLCLLLSLTPLLLLFIVLRTDCHEARAQGCRCLRHLNRNKTFDTRHGVLIYPWLSRVALLSAHVSPSDV